MVGGWWLESNVVTNLGLQVKEGYVLPRPDNCPSAFYRSIVAPCLSMKPYDRPRFADLASRLTKIESSLAASSAAPAADTGATAANGAGAVMPDLFGGGGHNTVADGRPAITDSTLTSASFSSGYYPRSLPPTPPSWCTSVCDLVECAARHFVLIHALSAALSRNWDFRHGRQQRRPCDTWRSRLLLSSRGGACHAAFQRGCRWT